MNFKERSLNITIDFFRKSNIKDYFGKDNLYTSYVAGSIFEGFGNLKSDIDVFVIVKDFKLLKMDYFKSLLGMDIFEKKNRIILAYSYKNVDFDIEIYELDFLYDYIDNLSKKDFSLKDIRYDLVHRLKFAECLSNITEFTELKSRINYDCFNMILPKKQCTFFNTKVTDIMGAFEAKEYNSSLKIALNLLEETMCSFLSLYGETNPSPKWLVKKIMRYDSYKEHDLKLMIVLEDAFSSISFIDLDKAKLQTIKVLRYCQFLNQKCEKIIQGDTV